MSEQSTTMKLNITNSQELRRSPRLNPRPRRSPRIKELNESDTEDVAPTETPDRDANEEGVVVRRHPTGSRSSTNTPSSNNDTMTTPKSKSTSKTTSSSKTASAVKFRHNSVSQLFHSTDPASHVRRASGKRLFRTASTAEEQGHHRSKRVKNGEKLILQDKRVIILARGLVMLGSILVVGSRLYC